MDCGEAQELNLDGLRGRLSSEAAAGLREHLSGCARCRDHAEAERVLSEVLDARLPQYAAPRALKRRLAASWPRSTPAATAARRLWGTARAAAMAAAVALAVGGPTAYLVERRSELRQLEAESVNDHLRVLGGAPLAQVAGGLHEVKPWFGGKLDFAPAVRFAGNDEFPLQGGAVEPFLDRRAALFVYKRRQHTATLFVVRDDGLAFPTTLHTRVVRGFSVALWSAGGQGYALVSDIDLRELLELQAEIASP